MVSPRRRGAPRPKPTPHKPAAEVSTGPGAHANTGSEPMADAHGIIDQTGDDKPETEAPNPDLETEDWNKPADDEAVDWGQQTSDPTHDLFEDFVNAVRASGPTPYDQLLTSLRVQGWLLQLREMHVQPTPVGDRLVTFAVLFGREASFMCEFDRFTIGVPGNQVAVSMWARANALTSAIFTVFDRLPPNTRVDVQLAVADPAPAVADPAPQQPNGDDDNGDWEPLALTERMTPDGLPVYFDPYTLGDTADDIVRSLYVGMEEDIPKIDNLEALAAFYTLNNLVFEYIREFKPEAFPSFTDLLDKQRAELEPPPPPAQLPGGRRPPQHRR